MEKELPIELIRQTEAEKNKRPGDLEYYRFDLGSEMLRAWALVQAADGEDYSQPLALWQQQCRVILQYWTPTMVYTWVRRAHFSLDKEHQLFFCLHALLADLLTDPKGMPLMSEEEKREYRYVFERVGLTLDLRKMSSYGDLLDSVANLSDAHYAALVELDIIRPSSPLWRG